MFLKSWESESFAYRSEIEEIRKTGPGKASRSENEHYLFRIKSPPGGNRNSRPGAYKADKLLTKAGSYHTNERKNSDVPGGASDVAK
jgi:hypothetical protein